MKPENNVELKLYQSKGSESEKPKAKTSAASQYLREVRRQIPGILRWSARRKIYNRIKRTIMEGAAANAYASKVDVYADYGTPRDVIDKMMRTMRAASKGKALRQAGRRRIIVGCVIALTLLVVVGVLVYGYVDVYRSNRGHTEVEMYTLTITHHMEGLTSGEQEIYARGGTVYPYRDQAPRAQ